MIITVIIMKKMKENKIILQDYLSQFQKKYLKHLLQKLF